MRVNGRATNRTVNQTGQFILAWQPPAIASLILCQMEFRKSLGHAHANLPIPFLPHTAPLPHQPRVQVFDFLASGQYLVAPVQGGVCGGLGSG